MGEKCDRFRITQPYFGVNLQTNTYNLISKYGRK